MLAFQQLIVPVFSFLLFIIFLRKWRSTATSARRKKSPPSPRKLPIIGNLHQLGTYPHRSLQSLSNHYGQLMLLHFGKVPVLVVSSAEAACEILKNQDLVFANRPKLSIADGLLYGSRDVAFAPYGDYWRQARSICVLQLLSKKRVQSFRRVREEETSAMVDEIRRLGSSSSSSVVNLSNVFVTLTNDVLCRVAFGRKYGRDGEGEDFKKYLGDLVELLGAWSAGDYIPWLGWIDRVSGLKGKVQRVAKLFDEFLESVVEEHRDRKKREDEAEAGKDSCGGDGEMDFVDILLEFQRENEGNSDPVEDGTIKAILLDIFAAGTDTTASVLEWTTAELIRNPRTMKTLQDEVRRVVKTKEEITEDDLDKMPYLKAVIKESMRLHVPLPLLLPHKSTCDTKIMGYDITFGTHVVINAWAIARDPSLWDNPEEFHPERFLEMSIDFKGTHFQLVPFGAGRRGCPGIAFAMSIDELALAKLVHRFNFGLPNGGREEELDMSESNGVTIHRKFPLLVVTTPHVC